MTVNLDGVDIYLLAEIKNGHTEIRSGHYSVKSALFHLVDIVDNEKLTIEDQARFKVLETKLKND